MRVEGAQQPLRLSEGDAVLIPSSVAHVLSDAPDTPPLPFEQGLARTRERAVPAGEAGSTNLLCAEITFDHRARHALADALPDVIHVPADAPRHGEALRSLGRLLLQETGAAAAGSGIVVTRLVDALLVLIVRHWLDTQEAASTGWLGALQDPKIGRALQAMHHDPGRPWSVEGLASLAGMSRAAFARRFPLLVGQTPREYLTRWRMSVAAKLLASTALAVEQVALRVGYESTTAFGNAFRRHFSVSPGRYRNRRDEPGT